MHPLLRFFLAAVESGENVKDFNNVTQKIAAAQTDEEELAAYATLLYIALKSKNDLVELRDTSREVFT